MKATHSATWMRVAVAAAAAHGIYTSIFGEGSIELRAVWAAISVGLAVAAIDPLRYWPAILTGLIAHLLPPVGYMLAGQERSAGADLWDAIWWAPLSFILLTGYRRRVQRVRERAPDILDIALRARTNRGITVEQLSRSEAVLLVFLRHTGCTFCREALADIASQRREIERAGATIVLVHMGEPEFGREFFRKYRLHDLHQISDPACGLYRAFGLRRGSLRAIFGPKAWVRGLDASLVNRHGFGPLAGDGFQMPGIFMVFHGQVLRSYRHQSAADRPNYARFVAEDAFSGMVS